MSEANVLPIAFFVFGALIVAMEILVLHRNSQGFGPQAVRTVGITIVLAIAAALTSTSLALDRLTPLIGLLGTPAGYLAGAAKPKQKHEHY